MKPSHETQEGAGNRSKHYWTMELRCHRYDQEGIQMSDQPGCVLGRMAPAAIQITQGSPLYFGADWLILSRISSRMDKPDRTTSVIRQCGEAMSDMGKAAPIEPLTHAEMTLPLPRAPPGLESFWARYPHFDCSLGHRPVWLGWSIAE